MPDVVKLLQCKFVETTFLKNLCGGLHLWMKICQFIHHTKIEDAKQYEDDILEFKRQLKMFYVHGSLSFLSKKSVGDKETMYMHVLRFYIPHIVDDTWKRFKLGVGFFTMQGFERRNKEAKSAFSNHTNKKGNQVKQCMYHLWNSFYYTQQTII